MKTPAEWAPILIAYMQKHPVTGIAAATLQIQTLVEMVQKDALIPPTSNDNDEGSAA